MLDIYGPPFCLGTVEVTVQQKRKIQAKHWTSAEIELKSNNGPVLTSLLLTVEIEIKPNPGPLEVKKYNSSQTLDLNCPPSFLCGSDCASDTLKTGQLKLGRMISARNRIMGLSTPTKFDY
ncbi:hypothetical protein DPMN_006085 [Dreissena polymorpha]|uniref:Uncharacterized protein n=1 Tax=Dreissena polymorpha TaxID=45954 RepID=A0A9D4MUK4_DREPO|nr:hypothetical protein DPMN_006085 [Dreissena polymorpha]